MLGKSIENILVVSVSERFYLQCRFSHSIIMMFSLFVTQVCEQCTDEFCDGTCLVFQYDSYQVKYLALVISKNYISIKNEIDQRKICMVNLINPRDLSKRKKNRP